MTILLVSHTAVLNGAERSLLALALGLHQQQILCRVLCPEYGPLPEVLHSHQIPVDYTKLPRPQRDWVHLLIFIIMWPFVVLRLGWWLRKNHIAAVYNNTIDGLYAPFAAKLVGIPCVWHIREVKPQNETWRRPFTWMLCYLPQNTIFNSTATMHAYSCHPLAHWQVIYNGVPIPEAPPAHAPDQPVVVGFAGQFVSHKRPAVFLQAIAQAKVRLPALQAVMAGNGPIWSEIQELARQWQLVDSVKMPGYLDDMSVFYGQIDIFVLTSEKEPFGRVVAEALAAGCPVIASRVGGIPEVMDESCGFLIDPDDVSAFADKIILLANDQPLRHRMGMAGRCHIIRHFSEEQYCRQLTAVLINGIQNN